ncbi:MAG: helix-turn-helix transcriptional regulator [Proteobacteria bacterium]|nr:helix-turn-helix transcriptional regulator [Pseudomonadota bacterium]
MFDSNLYKVIIDSMSAHVAILDEQGVIVETNRSWQDFARANGMKEPYDSIGINYLQTCEAPSGQHGDEGPDVAEGIRRVLRGDLPEFFTHYPCHSPSEKRWFAVRVVPFRESKNSHIIITHENITPIIETQKALEEKEVELRRERERLEETNIALRVLLRQRGEDKTRIEETVYINVDRLVLPYVEQLLQGKLTDKQRTLTEVIDANLRDIVSPFLQNISTLNMLLTPQEIAVANMVRSGRSSKEIAEVLGISTSGVDFHRKKLRQKLGLTNSSRNLRSYLLSLERNSS